MTVRDSPTSLDQEAARLELLRAILLDDAERADGQLFLRTLGPKVGSTRRPGPEYFVADPHEASRIAVSHAERFDVYVGGMTRHPYPSGSISGRKDCCRRGRLVWADCDTDHALDRLASFPHPPTFLVESGGRTDSGRAKVHAWWRLDEPLAVPDHEQLLSALIAWLGSDPAARDASRVLRVPGTRHLGADRGVACVARADTVPLAAMRDTLSGTHEVVRAGCDPPPRGEGAGGLTGLLAAPPVGEDSGRNDWLVQVAGHLVRRHSSWGAARGAILEANRERLTHPLSAEELEDTVLASARRYWEDAHPKGLAGGTESPAEAKLLALTEGWALPSPAVKVEIWGRSPTSPVDVYLADQTKISIDEVQHTGKLAVLCQVLMARTGGRTLGPATAKQAELLRLQQILWQLADIQVEHDARAEVIEWVPRGLLASELRRTASRLGLGVPRAEALEAFAARCPLEPVGALVAALERAERHGAPLAPALAALATDARAERARATRDHAARAAPKIQLVIALLLVPAVLLLVGAALAGALLG